MYKDKELSNEYIEKIWVPIFEKDRGRGFAGFSGEDLRRREKAADAKAAEKLFERQAMAEAREDNAN